MKRLKRLGILLGMLVAAIGIFLGVHIYASGISVTLEQQLSMDNTSIRYISTISNVEDLDSITEIHVLLKETKNGKSRTASANIQTVYESVSGENGKEKAANTYYAVYTLKNINTRYGSTLSCTFEYIINDETKLTTNEKTYDIPNNVVSEVIDITGVKTSYVLGEAFTIDGVSVDVEYQDGSQATLGEEGVTVDASAINTGEAGTYNVTVTGKAGFDSKLLEVTYSEDYVVSLDATVKKSQAVKQGETYTPDENVAVIATYNSGAKKVVTAEANYTVNSSTIGDTTCTVSYGGQSDSYTVKVKSAAVSIETYTMTVDQDSQVNRNGDVTELFSIVNQDSQPISCKFEITANSNSASTSTYFLKIVRLYNGTSGNGTSLVIKPTSGEMSEIKLVVRANTAEVAYTVNGESYSASTASQATETITFTNAVDEVVIQDTATVKARLDIYSIEVTLKSEGGSSSSHVHTYNRTDYKNPTCTEAGFITYECTSCHEDYTVDFEAAGHSFDVDPCEYCGTKTFIAPEGFFTSDDAVLYTIEDENPYGVDLTKYGADTQAIFYNAEIVSVLADPYVNVTYDDFYADYKISTTYQDTYFRTQHGFISGTTDYSTYIPEAKTVSVSETAARCSTGVYILTPAGKYVGYIVNAASPYVIFYGGAYVGLEEVAAYLLAFGEVPANSNYDKNNGRTTAINKWGEYARVNVDDFSGDNSKYKYEPILTDISGCGGSTLYTETDFGTLGGFTVGSTTQYQYVSGTSINRGACRFVFVNMKNNIYDINLRHVFYTHNHYNDFQEYLNYDGGWSILFGNETAGNPYCSGSSSWQDSYNTPTSVPAYNLVQLSAIYS